ERDDRVPRLGQTKPLTPGGPVVEPGRAVEESDGDRLRSWVESDGRRPRGQAIQGHRLQPEEVAQGGDRLAAQLGRVALGRVQPSGPAEPVEDFDAVADLASDV